MSSKLTDTQLTIGNGTLTATAYSGTAASLQDYGSIEPRPMQIGYNGNGLSSCTYLAAYDDTGTKIKDINTDNVTVGTSRCVIDYSSGQKNYFTDDDGGSTTWIMGWYAADGQNYWKCTRHIVLDYVGGAVANDYADSIDIPKNTIIYPGYCYCFDGENYYKSSKYLDEGIIGICSDTYAFNTGINYESESDTEYEKLPVAVSGFVLAYVDKIYKPGTPLTCTKNGYLTEIKSEDKIKYPERIVGTFWKEEKEEIWKPKSKKIKVNGRHWIKVR